MSDKKILLLTPDFPPMRGGVATYLKALCEYFQGDLEVITEPHPQWQSFDKHCGCAVYRQPLLYKRWWPRWMKSVKLLKEYKDRYRLIITSHVLPFGSACMVAKRKTGTPYVVILHGMDVRLAQASARKKRLATNVLKEAQLVVVNSKALAREVAEVFGVKESLVVYPNVPDRSIDIAQKNDGVFRLLTVARLVQRKGHQHVLSALSRLWGTGRLKNFHYDIVGDGPMRETLEQMIRNLSLENHVTIHTQVTDEQKEQFYTDADVFIMPTENDPVDKEGFGLVYIEAAQHGLPSIARNIPGVDEAVIHEQTGILLKSVDQEEIATAINAMANDQEYRLQLGVQAQQHAKQFTHEEQLGKLKEYLV